MAAPAGRLLQIAANIEAKHSAEHDGYDACECFDRLPAAVRGEPDPDGEFYRWPIYRYGCEEAPQFGPETAMDSLMRTRIDGLPQAYSRAFENLLGYAMPDELRERLMSRMISPPVIIAAPGGAP